MSYYLRHLLFLPFSSLFSSSAGRRRRRGRDGRWHEAEQGAGAAGVGRRRGANSSRLHRARLPTAAAVLLLSRLARRRPRHVQLHRDAAVLPHRRPSQHRPPLPFLPSVPKTTILHRSSKTIDQTQNKPSKPSTRQNTKKNRSREILQFPRKESWRFLAPPRRRSISNLQGEEKDRLPPRPVDARATHDAHAFPPPVDARASPLTMGARSTAIGGDGGVALPVAPLSSKAAAAPPEYEMPSMKEWLVSRVLALDFLRPRRRARGRRAPLLPRGAPGAARIRPPPLHRRPVLLPAPPRLLPPQERLRRRRPCPHRLMSMAALHHHHSHQIKAPTPTWLIVKAIPPPRDGAKKLAAAAYSPLLLSPSVWQRAQQASVWQASAVAAGERVAGERGGGGCCWCPVAAQLRWRPPPA
nr:WAS/WASL-interacting protein family member 1 [Oryza sativa Japonica Group]